jgi:hypothetical protein
VTKPSVGPEPAISARARTFVSVICRSCYKLRDGLGGETLVAFTFTFLVFEVLLCYLSPLLLLVVDCLFCSRVLVVLFGARSIDRLIG